MGTNLTAVLPEDSLTIQDIYSYYKKEGDSEGHRGYLGASEIGHECERYLWYSFRNCIRRDIPGRMYRLWQTGHEEESRLIRDLKNIGCAVYHTDTLGDQYGFSALGGHFCGHVDGVVEGISESPKTPHLLECKTYNAKSFRHLRKYGLVESQPKYAAQMQVYMHFMKLTRGLHLAKNKDTDELYSERLKYDKATACALGDKAERIIRAHHPPERIRQNPNVAPCVYCDALYICWEPSGEDAFNEDALPLPCVSCRQCCHATPLLDESGAMWHCEFLHSSWKYGDWLEHCLHHMVLPGLITFAEPIDHKVEDYGEYILYQSVSGKVWKQGSGPEAYSTEQLMGMKIEEVK